MQPKVTLTVYDVQGNARQVAVRAKRFTIGRIPDNDLVVDDHGLSRRHAMIETFDGLVQISDCGSQNGTLVNRRLITGPTVLHNGDAILLGEACDIRVHISDGSEALTGAVAYPVEPADRGGYVRDISHDSMSAPRSPITCLTVDWFSKPVIAVATIAMVVVVAAVLIPVSKMNRRNIVSPDGPALENVNKTYTPPVVRAPTPLPPTDDKQVMEKAARLMAGISSDPQRYYFPESSLKDIERKVSQYSTSTTLASALNAIKQRGAKIIEEARREKMEVGLLIYTALAETDGGRTGRDPVGVASQVLPSLLIIKKHIGTELADRSLLIVAAYKVGPSTKRSHPLIVMMRRLGKDPQTDNNIWYLHNHYLRNRDGINDQVYEFVLSFLAIGIIAQAPRQFKIDADPLAFNE